MKINKDLIKNITIGVLVAVAAVSTVLVINYNRVINNNGSIMEYMENERLELQNQYDSLQVAYNNKDKEYIKLDSIIDNRNKQLAALKLENNHLQLKLADLENEMANVSSDSSYNYLMHRYIPTQDSLKYGFAPNQVKSIHFDVLAFDYTKLLNSNLDSTINVLTVLSNTNLAKFETCSDQNSILIQQKGVMSKQIESLEAINENYTKQIRRQRTKSTAFGLGALGLVSYIVFRTVTNK